MAEFGRRVFEKNVSINSKKIIGKNGGTNFLIKYSRRKGENESFLIRPQFVLVCRNFFSDCLSVT